MPFWQAVDKTLAFTNPGIRIIYLHFLKWGLKFLTSPAPWKRIMLSERRVLVIRREANSPATATDAVPWISSLKVQYVSRYLSNKRNALLFPKSSNWKIVKQYELKHLHSKHLTMSHMVLSLCDDTRSPELRYFDHISLQQPSWTHQ